MSDLNDPRVLFAAERTLFAWNRTGISLMAFGFVVERFELYLQYLGIHQVHSLQRPLALVGGIGFILLGVFIEFYSARRYRSFLTTLTSTQVPVGYNLKTAMVINALAGIMGTMLCIYLASGFF